MNDLVFKDREIKKPGKGLVACIRKCVKVKLAYHLSLKGHISIIIGYSEVLTP